MMICFGMASEEDGSVRKMKALTEGGDSDTD